MAIESDKESAQTHDAEAELVQRAKERLPSAWAEIYDAHYRKLYLYCYARTGNQGTAADLASSVYLAALEGIDGYTYRGRPLLAWLYRIARNLVSDHLRANEREAAALERAVSGQPEHEPDPSSGIGDEQDISAALRQLTDDQQQIVALRYYAGLTTAEIAQAMDRSEQAVYSLEVRALAALHRLLDPDSLAERPAA